MADRIGRRAIVLVSVSFVAVGMALSAIAANMPQLAVLRVITGIGIGGILPTVSVLVAEYSSDRWRSTLVSLHRG
jgi:MFS family permease